MRALNSKLKLGLLIVLAIFCIGLFGPLFVSQSPLDMDLQARFLPPSSEHWFGTDHNGTDILSVVVYGARVSVAISVIVVLLNLFLGLLIGSFAGYWGGLPDLVIMRFVDMVFGFPGFFSFLAVAAVMQQTSLFSVVFALCVTMASYSIARGEILHLATASSSSLPI